MMVDLCQRGEAVSFSVYVVPRPAATRSRAFTMGPSTSA